MSPNAIPAGHPAGLRPSDVERWTARAVGQIAGLAKVVEPAQCPYVSRDGRYTRALVEAGPHDVPPWTAGFWTGELILAHLVTHEPWLRRRAEDAFTVLALRLRARGERFDHDLGFQFLLSAVSLYELFDDAAAGEVAIEAAERLVNRFNPRGGFIRAHGWRGSAGAHIEEPGVNDGPPGRFIVDTMMNLPLLSWAHRHTGEARYREIALAHARTSVDHLVRPDGWVYHAFDVDAGSGAPVGPATIQGATATSPWSRAQAWAIYGFALAGRHLDEPRFTEVAATVADTWLGACAPDPLPPWDFSRPDGPGTLPDSSAGAIAASGLAVLATGLPGASGEPYRVASARLVAALEHRCAADPARGEEGVLTRACYHHPAGIGLQESASWGDYFHLEALTRLSGGRGLYDLV